MSETNEQMIRRVVENVMDGRAGIVRAAVREELNDWGQRIGLDTGDPIEQQADFRHLRRWRKVVEGGGMKIVTSAVFVMISGVLGWLAFGLLPPHR